MSLWEMLVQLAVANLVTFGNGSVMAAVLLVRAWRTGGWAMLAMMDAPPASVAATMSPRA